MKAVIYTEYGSPDVLRLTDIDQPVPQGSQVLVKVKAASVNAGDYRVRTGKPILMRLMAGGLRRPKRTRVGMDLAGLVEAVGEQVTRFRVGDEVFGCGSGTMAEYALVKQENLALKPISVSWVQAAATPVAGLTALQGLRLDGGLRPGQKVLIQGASGGVGTFAVQLARAQGAEVTAVCSPKNIDMVRTLGAKQVIDYTRQDFTKSDLTYDLIFAVNGYHSLRDYRRALNPQGVYICAGGALRQIFEVMLLGAVYSQKGGKSLRSMGIAQVTHEDLRHLGELLEAGTISPVIDRQYPLDEVVAAFRYVEERHAQGKVVITMEG